jgi:hypothetical protein
MYLTLRLFVHCNCNFSTVYIDKMRFNDMQMKFHPSAEIPNFKHRLQGGNILIQRRSICDEVSHVCSFQCRHVSLFFT